MGKRFKRNGEKKMKQLYELSRKFPKDWIKKAPKGKFGNYVPHPVITQRLLEVCGPFDWEVVELKNFLSWFKPKNYMGWHTNCRKVKHKDYRLYFVWCDEDNKSFFRWRDSKTGKIYTKWEKKGWNLNWFQLGNCENPTWHCIYSNCNRFSIGFQVLNPINGVLSEIQKG